MGDVVHVIAQRAEIEAIAPRARVPCSLRQVMCRHIHAAGTSMGPVPDGGRLPMEEIACGCPAAVLYLVIRGVSTCQ